MRADSLSPGPSTTSPVVSGGCRPPRAFGAWLTGSTQKKSWPGGT